LRDLVVRPCLCIATVYGVCYESQESTSALGYLVNHTSTLMVIDKSGELKLILPFDLTEEQVAADLARFVG
jgi:protein SCO1/2